MSTASPPISSDASTSSNAPPPAQVHLSLPPLPPRLYVLPVAGLVLGSLLGLTRGARLASLRFLAENAHRPPTTVRGWYFYNKTKNYRVLMGGLGEAGREGARVGVVAGVWAAVEWAAEEVGGWVKEVKEVGAGVGSAGVFSVLYRLPRKAAGRAMVLGLLVGCTVGSLRRGQGWLKTQAAVARAQKETDENESRHGEREQEDKKTG